MDDLGLLDVQSPMVFGLTPPPDIDLARNLVDGPARSSEILVTDPVALEALIDHPQGPTSRMLRNSLAQGGKGAVFGDKQATELVVTIETGFEGAADLRVTETASALKAVENFLGGVQAFRLTQVIQAVWDAAGGRSDQFPGRVERSGRFNASALLYLLEYMETADLAFWQRLGKDLGVAQLTQLADAAELPNFQHLVNANLGTIRAKACIVRANPLGVGVDAASSAAFVWRPEGRVLHLLGPTFICLLGQTKDDIEPQVSVKKLPKTRGPSDNGAGIAVAEFMDRWRDIPVTEVQGSDSVEVLDVSAIGSPIDKGRFEAKMKTFLTTPTIRKAQVSTPSGGVTVDFISSTGTAVTNSDMRMAHLIRVAVPMLVSLDGGEYARIRDAFNVAGSSTEPMLPFGADDGGSGDSA